MGQVREKLVASLLYKSMSYIAPNWAMGKTRKQIQASQTPKPKFCEQGQNKSSEGLAKLFSNKPIKQTNKQTISGILSHTLSL